LKAPLRDGLRRRSQGAPAAGAAAGPAAIGARPWIERARAAGANPRHVELLLRAWLAGRALDASCAERSAPFSARLIAALRDLASEVEALATVASEHPSADGSVRLLVRLRDGLAVESVLLARGALCVSTQAGCAVGCLFCRTGQDGLVRQLSAEEILAQVALARRRRAVRRVVFMGMGEPSQNLAAVLESLERLGREGHCAHKNLVFSTIGDRKCFGALAAHSVKPALALSLHTTNRELREHLLPRAPRIAPEELVELADAYARRVGHPVQYQWTLLAGINDGDTELERLVELLRGRHGIVNFIPFNPIDARGGDALGAPTGSHAAFERTPIERTVHLVRSLRRAGILATIRRSGGGDVDGACGQLKARLAPAPAS
jgi:23S rRNA (adenine2503-C2)-methyltransferase